MEAADSQLRTLKHIISTSHIEARLAISNRVEGSDWSIQSFKIGSRSLSRTRLCLHSLEWGQKFASHHHRFPKGANKSLQLRNEMCGKAQYSTHKSKVVDHTD